MPKLTHTTFDQLEGIEQAFDRDGGVIIDNIVSAEAAVEIRSAFETALQDQAWCNTEDGDHVLGNQLFGLTTKRLHRTAQYHPRVIDCLTNPDWSAS